MSQCDVMGLLVYTGLEMGSCAGVVLGVAGGWGIAGGVQGWAVAGQDRGLRPTFLPSAAVLALYLPAAIPLALLPPPSARAGISEGPHATFRVCRSHSCLQLFPPHPAHALGDRPPTFLLAPPFFSQVPKYS